MLVLGLFVGVIAQAVLLFTMDRTAFLIARTKGRLLCYYSGCLLGIGVITVWLWYNILTEHVLVVILFTSILLGSALSASAVVKTGGAKNDTNGQG